MNAMTRLPVVVVLAAAALPLAAPAHADTGFIRTSRCNLPNDRDLIIWQRVPRVEHSAVGVGEVDLVHCKPTLDTWQDGTPTGPGYCAKIAWASDNPDYDINVRPAPR
jgi:hypothetical protein